MNDKWISSELVEVYADRLRDYKAKGLGRRRIASRIESETGRRCTDGVVAIALGKIGLASPHKSSPQIEIKDRTPEPEEQSIDDLIASRIDACRRKISKATRHKKTLELPAEPTGLFILGDPHVDNEGCDWDTLFRHIKLMQETEGVLTACVGDMHDNWIGRLQRCYANSSATAEEGWKLSEWLLGDSGLNWVAIVGGNHDAWANGPGVDPLAWLSKKCGVNCYAPDEIRITLTWADCPDLEPVIWILRHDFSGRSWYHPTHGPNKEAMLDGKCHILTAGHIHQWGELTTEQRHGRITNAIRIRGYKRADAYATQKGFSEQAHGEAVLLVIDPHAVGVGRVTVFWDLERGCEFLTMLRNSR